MKAKVNLTVDRDLLTEVKMYAQKKHTSVSELFEGFIRTLTKPSKQQNILDLLEELDPPKISADADLKKLFYEEQSKKYGF